MISHNDMVIAKMDRLIAHVNNLIEFQHVMMHEHRQLIERTLLMQKRHELYVKRIR